MDCLRRGEAPWASHLLYPQVLQDSRADERALGIAAGLAWGEVAEATAVYTDRGISAGMRLGIEAAKAAGRAVEYRSLRVRKKGGLTRALVAQMGLRKSKKAPRGNLLRRACAQERFPSGAPVAQIARGRGWGGAGEGSWFVAPPGQFLRDSVNCPRLVIATSVTGISTI
jgi:hypothetical protein